MKNPWHLVSRKEVYENPWIRVEHHEVLDPSGKPGIYGQVRFKNYAIGIIPLDENNNTWLVGQYRYPLDIYSWEIPMGGGPIGESILASAQRELQEETGIQATQWTELMLLHTSNSVTNEIGYVYLAEDLSYGPTNFESTEDLQVKKLPFSAVYDMVMNGEITDAISVSGILKLANMRKEILG